jgi:hypothetical protein
LSRKTDSRRTPLVSDRPKGGRVTLKAVNDALAKRGSGARLMKASGYFYFDSGEAANWIDKTVYTPTVGSRTLEQWLEEFDRLEKANRDLLKAVPPRASKKQTGRRGDRPGPRRPKRLTRSK